MNRNPRLSPPEAKPRKRPASNHKRAVVLLSGGLDSTTVLFYALRRGYHPQCLIFDYGQMHRKEIRQAQKLAGYAGCPYETMRISLPWGGSALLDKNIPVPHHRSGGSARIPVTYVPARNIIFLSFAVSFAEAIGARTVFIGANAVDYSGYPDCRPEFYDAFSRVLKCGLKSGVERKPIKVATPLMHMSKAQIIQKGLRWRVPYHLTWSCYKGGPTPCGSCDSCFLRAKGFQSLGIPDPLMKYTKQ
jgi:7-cyano-7-deazaguanine synthase